MPRKRANRKRKKDEDNNIFRAEKIVDHRYVGVKLEFLIKWNGYDESENSWEPFDHIYDNELLEEYNEFLEENGKETINAEVPDRYSSDSIRSGLRTRKSPKSGSKKSPKVKFELDSSASDTKDDIEKAEEPNEGSRRRGRPTNAEKQKRSIIKYYGEQMLPFLKEYWRLADLMSKEMASETAETNEPDIYEAERIIKHRYRNGNIQFLMKWTGYGPAHNTWEPEENIFCRKLIEIYKEKLERKGKSMSRRHQHGRGAISRNTNDSKGGDDSEFGTGNLRRSARLVTSCYVTADGSSSSTYSSSQSQRKNMNKQSDSETSTESNYKSSTDTSTQASSSSNSSSSYSDRGTKIIPMKRRGPGRPSNAQKRRESIINCYSADLLPFITVTDVSVNGSTCTFVECKKREGFFNKKKNIK